VRVTVGAVKVAPYSIEVLVPPVPPFASKVMV
jgi:hypothetical protein